MLRRLILVLPLFAASCSYEHFIRYPLSDDQVEAAAPSASQELDCPAEELETHYRTLLTRTMSGCDKQVVYSYDWMLDRWWGDFDATPEGEPLPAPPAHVQDDEG